MLIYLTLSELTLPVDLRYAETARFFSAPDLSAPTAGITPAAISDWELAEALRLGMPDSPESEYSILSGACSDVLIPFDRALFHAVALRWRGFAWLIVAASGVGKTTQFRTLDALRPGEFSMICGDRPVLDFRGDRVLVWPSPWDGKEHLHGAPPSPLAGIIFLERGEKNNLVALTEREAILRAYPAWIYNAKDASAVEKIAAFETKLLTSVPLWRLTVATVPHPPHESLPLAGKGDRAAVDEVPPVLRTSPVKPSPRGEGGTRSVTNEVLSDDCSLPPLPDVSASAKLLLDSVFTEAILPRD